MMALSGCAVVVIWLLAFSSSTTSSSSWKDNTVTSPRMMRRMTGEQVNVFMGYADSAVARKKMKDLSSQDGVNLVVSHGDEQVEFLKSDSCVDGALQRYQAFLKKDQAHLAHELWKYCVLAENGGLYLDAESPLLVSVEEIFNLEQNVAVESNYFQNTIHGSILLLKDGEIAIKMAHLMVETPIATLLASPLLLAKTLHTEIQTTELSKWHFYQHSCIMNPLQGRKLSSYSKTNRLAHYCPLDGGYCCQVLDSQTVVLMTKHPILPNQLLPVTLLQPYSPSGTKDDDDLPFISTIREKVNTRPKDAPLTPNFFETLLKNNCLPSDLQCSNCLRDKKGADCTKCKAVCPCYCKTLCKVSVDDKFVSKELTVTPPKFARDPNRLVPRIIHQTWFEEVTPDKYPNMSRLIESFKQSGWEYKFYDDKVARDVLAKHFPPEILQAYDALRPGAFKADLFRYCVLLIYGGLYADMDVLLESNLDAAVGPNIGFMVPVDEPGTVRAIDCVL